MQRLSCRVRPDWPLRNVLVGFHFHISEGDESHPEQPYWVEGNYYAVTVAEATELARVAHLLHELAMEAAETIVTDAGRLASFCKTVGIPKEAAALIVHSWETAPPTLLGRFDLAWQPGMNDPVLIEYNAETPGGMVEHAAQQLWAQDVFPDEDQFSALGEALRESFESQKDQIGRLHVGISDEDEGEDAVNALYYLQAARDAGIDVVTTSIQSLTFDAMGQTWRDQNDEIVTSFYHLYPMEWMLNEGPGAHMMAFPDAIHWIEPIWKILLSSKYLLAVLWELNPGHPNLLPAYLDGPNGMLDYVTKPLHGHEGQGVSLYRNGILEHKQNSEDDGGPLLFQQRVEFPGFGDKNQFKPEFGMWIVDGLPVGLCIREPGTGLPVIDFYSRAIPHIVTG